MKKLIALLTCIAMVTTIFSSAAVTMAEEETTGGVFRYAAELDLDNLDPFNDAQSTVQDMYLSACYDTLWLYDEHGEMVYQLAESYEFTDDTTLKIKLRDNVYYHNGNKLKAEDVIYSFARFQASPILGQHVASIDFENSYAEDDLTVVFKLYEYTSVLISYFGSRLFVILSKDWCEEVGDEGIAVEENGTGAYTLEDWSMGSSMTLKAWPEWWGGTPKYDEIDVGVFTDNNTRYLEFEAGNYDVALIGNSSDIEYIEDGGIDGAYLYRTIWPGVTNFTFNLWQFADFWQDINLRKAFAHAIDVEKMVAGIAGAGYEVSDSPVLQKTAPGYEAVGHYEYDPELAKEYLKEAGYEEGELTIDMVVSTNGMNVRFAEAIQEYMRQIGVTINIEPVDHPTFIGQMISGQLIGGLSTYPGASDPLETLDCCAPGSHNPFCEFNDEYLIDEYNRAFHTKDEEEKLDALKNIQEYMYENYTVIPIYDQYFCYGVWEDKVGDLSGKINNRAALHADLL